MAARRANTPKEWALAIGGGLALSAGLVWMLRGGDEPLPPASPPPAPVVAALVPPPAAAITAPPDLTLAGLRAGPDGGMAIVVAGGKQYLLRPGRSLRHRNIGGIRLLRVEPGRAILAGPAGEMVLAFGDATPAGPVGRTAPPGGDPTPWRLALGPVKASGRLAGWRLDSLAGLPALARAGLRPGDVLLSANGTDLISEEKIMELPQELAVNGRLLLVYRRGAARREAVITP